MQALTLLLLATLLALTGCGQAQSRDGQRDLLRYRDDRSGVTCWALNGSSSISCLPDSSLLQKATPTSQESRASRTSAPPENGALQATPLPQVSEAFQL